MRDNLRMTSENVRFSEAEFPLPFKQQLEFSSPARGTMNIVHTGMLIPESHEIFVCAKGCLRGVVLTAAEMGAMGRYSALEIHEEDVLNGGMESMMIEGVADIISKLSYRPRAILLFISCQHFFLAYDRELVFEVLRDRFKDIEFIDCYMIPTLRKSGITPDQKMRLQLYAMLKPMQRDEKQINLMGSNHAIERSSEIYPLIEKNGAMLTSINDCETFDEYLDLAKGQLNIIYEPIALPAAEDMEERLGIPYIYMPNVFRPVDIEKNYAELGKKLGVVLDGRILDEKRQELETSVIETLSIIGDTPIAIDYTFTFRLLNLARMLSEFGFNVTDVFADGFFLEEETDFNWLRRNRPDMILHPTNRPTMRYEKNLNQGALALGQKAACFMGTDNFVNIAECGGFFGFDGAIKILELMRDAFENEKDRRAIVQKKGTKVPCLMDDEGFCCAKQPQESLVSTGVEYSAGLVPTYSSDEFGICSTLYELGGLVVMHDASGCNSTYTTHDEPRWYDQESMVYISALSEIEAIMGDDDKLIEDVCDAAEQLKPKFVALIGAPIPYMMGTDFKALASIIEERLGIPCFGFQSNGMDAYGKGISMATKALVERFCREPEAEHEALRVNILGATPLDFALNGSMDSIKQWLASNGMEPWCSFSMDSSLEIIERAAEADINLVLTYGGLAAAKYMKRTFGIPYVCGVPYGTYGEELVSELKRETAQCTEEDDAVKTRCTDEAEVNACVRRMKTVLIGEEISRISLAEALEKEFPFDITVLSATDTDEKFLREKDRRTESEDSIIRAIDEIKPELVIADPFYQAIVPEGIDFYPMPHEAFSGRIYDSKNLNLINCRLRDVLADLEKYDA